MERSRKVFFKIAEASNNVITAANKYADLRDSRRVARSHFQLEGDMRKVFVACKTVADILGKLNPLHGHELDVRLQDWLDTDEPQKCLDTLVQMKKLLQGDASSWTSWVSEIIGRGTTTTQDKIKEAIDIFSSCKGYFHFLFSTEMWDSQRYIQQQHDVSKPLITQGQSITPEQHPPASLQMVINATVPVPADHSGGHMRQIPGEGSSVRPQYSLVPIQTGLSAIVSGTTIRDRRHTVGQSRHEMHGRQLRIEEVAEAVPEEILQWLNGLNCTEKQDIILSLRQPGTCNWLFDTVQYKHWKDSDDSFLWLRGKPGAGKSVLAASVIDSFENSRRQDEILTYFYCDVRDERFTSAPEVLRSIISQFLRQLRDSTVSRNLLLNLYKAKERGGTILKNSNQLAAFMATAAESLNQKPLVIIDALDECNNVRGLIQALKIIKGCVRLFVTSRPLHVIMSDLFDLPSLSMDDMTANLSADIKLHVTRELDARHRLRGLDTRFKVEICTVLCDRADGMFRWIRCSIDTLDRCLTRKAVRNALSGLPDGLDETYERILRAIDLETGEGQLARQILIWLVAALRPLQLSEVMEGLSIDLQKRTLDLDGGPMHSGALLDVCGSLVSYSEKTGIITLSHSSVKEYLTGEFILPKLPQYYINWECAHLHLAQTCMCYISICLRLAQYSGDSNSSPSDVSGGRDGFSKDKDQPVRTSWPLSSYVLDDAPNHFRHLGPQFELVLPDVKVLEGAIQQHPTVWNDLCLSTGQTIRSTNPSWPMSRHDLTLYILVAFAPDALLYTFLRHTMPKPKEGTNPLVYTAYFNKDRHARVLLSRGARLNHRGLEIDCSSLALPIEVALQNQHYDMVTLFLAEGSTVPSPMFRRVLLGDFPSMPSSVRMKFLQCDDFAEGNEGLPRVISEPRLLGRWVATEQDSVATIRRLIQVFDHCFSPWDKSAHFHFAVKNGYCSVVQYLINLGIPLPLDILFALNYSGDQTVFPMLHLLLENRASVFVHSGDGNTVLYDTLRRCCREDDALEVTKLLVHYGCKPFEVNPLKRTSLHMAVERNYVSVAQYFFDEVGGPAPPDMFITLDCLGSWKTAQMIRLLVEKGANPLAHTASGDSVLHVLLRPFYNDDTILEAVRVLVGYGCDPLEANSDGKTPLDLTIQRGTVSVTRYLLSLGAHLPFDALLVALHTRRQKLSMIELLIEQGASVHARTSNGSTVLHVAARVGFSQDYDDAFRVFKLLVESGSDPTTSNTRGETPLRIAMEHGHVEIVKYLLSLNVSCPSDILFTAIESKYLYHQGVLYAVKTLVASGCNLRARNSAGHTPLHVAVVGGHLDAAEYLLSVVDEVELGSLLLAALLAPPDVQDEMTQMLTRHRAKAEGSPPPPANRAIQP